MIAFQRLRLSETIPWYNWWIQQQLDQQPPQLFSVLPYHESLSAEGSRQYIIKIWQEIGEYMVNCHPISVYSIVGKLVEQKLLDLDKLSETSHLACHLVFAIIGWQTMLFRPDSHLCSSHQIRILDETGGYRGRSHFFLQQEQSAFDKPLHDLLLGFGMMLPPGNFDCDVVDVEANNARLQTTIRASSFNAHLLSSVSGFRIKWTDCMSCHLELDVSSNTLFLFRYPSFCLANLLHDGSSIYPRTSLHACAVAPEGDGPWATVLEVDELLREIIRSYRILFGQNKESRR